MPAHTIQMEYKIQVLSYFVFEANNEETYLPSV